VSAEATKTTKRRLAAVLSADAAGCSRLMGENEEATIDALTAFDGLRRIDPSLPGRRSIDRRQGFR